MRDRPVDAPGAPRAARSAPSPRGTVLGAGDPLTESGMGPRPELDALLEDLRVHQAELELHNDELRITQRALERSRDRYFQLFDQAPVAYLMLDGDLAIEEANRAAERLLSRPVESLRGTPLVSFVAPSGAEAMRRLLSAAPPVSGRPRGPLPRHGLEVELWRSGEPARYVRVECAPLTGDEHRSLLLVTLMDVTRRVVAEHSLEESEARHRTLVVRSMESERRYRTLFERSRDAILLISEPTGLVAEANAAAGRLFRCPPDRLEGTPIDGLFAWSQARDPRTTRTAVLGLFDRRRGGGSAPADQRLFAKCFDGRLAPVDLGVEHVELDAERLAVATMRDRSDLVRAEAERETLELHLRQAQKMEAVGTLAGGVAHDMNNVLGAIVGLASATLTDDGLGAATRTDLERLLRAAERGAELTRNLLGFARKGKFRREPVDVAALLTRVADLLRRTVSKQVTITVDAADGLPPVLGDQNQLSHATMNLCLNAIDAMEGVGRLALTADLVSVTADEARQHPDLEAGSYVQVTVRDSGRGMDEQTRARAFEPFFTTKPPGRGTGLGLSMVYGTARGHGGAVLIDSAPGEGTAIRLHLPIPSGGDDRILVPRPTPAAVRRVEPGAGHQLGVLVVDDEPDVRRSTERLLQTLGHRVIPAESGDQALQIYRSTESEGIDVVLLDMIMPGLDGEQTFHRLREIDPSVRVIVCSGFSRNERVEAMCRDGAAGFLEKPFARNDLRDALEQMAPAD